MDNPAPNSVISTVAAIDNAGQYPFWGVTTRVKVMSFNAYTKVQGKYLLESDYCVSV